MRIQLALFTILIIASSYSSADDGWTDLTKELNPEQAAIAGSWSTSDNGLSTDAASSSRIALPFEPKNEYEFRVSFTRQTGVHSVALMFVIGNGQATFEVDAWGQHLAGIQNINNQSIQQNATRTENMTLENGRRYTMHVEVRRDGVKGYLDGKLIAEHKTNGSDLSMPDVWRMPNAKALGLGAYQAQTLFHTVEVRNVSGGKPLMVASTPPSSPTPRPATPSTPAKPASTGKRVLIVIANQDFFYREYFDPRQALERDGITVEVAAGRKQMCRPHANSGQQGSGEVMPDLAITDVDPDRYDAIMFSGGWGSSMYQYAFQGDYTNRIYNGERQVKSAVNRLLTEFIEQDKYVGALCHGVSVLAWARVNGRSILNGRRAVGSPRQSPQWVANGQRQQPLSRWNAEVNGARLTPMRSIGNPSTSADDVLVDGKLITGEDDNSAQLFGETLAKLLME